MKGDRSGEEGSEGGGGGVPLDDGIQPMEGGGGVTPLAVDGCGEGILLVEGSRADAWRASSVTRGGGDLALVEDIPISDRDRARRRRPFSEPLFRSTPLSTPLSLL